MTRSRFLLLTNLSRIHLVVRSVAISILMTLSNEEDKYANVYPFCIKVTPLIPLEGITFRKPGLLWPLLNFKACFLIIIMYNDILMYNQKLCLTSRYHILI